jgi:hypothetical protein
MTDDFDLEIRHRNGAYLIIARSYGVAVRSKELEAGLEEAIARVNAVAEIFREANLAVPLAGEHRLPRGYQAARLADYLPPAVVGGVVLSVFVLLASMPLFNAVASLNQIVEQVSRFENVGHNVARMLIRAGNAMDNVPPERKEELRLAVRKIMRGLDPIIEEVGDSVGRNPSPMPPPPR